MEKKILTNGEKAENRILEILNKNGRLRHADLQRIIVDDEEICAKRTFDKVLVQLVTSGKIIRKPITKYEVWYEMISFTKKQNNVNQFFKSQLDEVTKYLNLFLKKEPTLNHEQKAIFIIHLYDSIDYLEKMVLTLQTLSDLKKTKVVHDDMIKKIKEFSDTVYSKCSKFISDPMVSQYIMSIKGKQYSNSLIKIHKILDGLPEAS